MADQAATLAKLELLEILERLARHCQFTVAAERALELGPSADRTQVAYLLDVTSEAVELLTEQPDLTVGGARDIRPLLDRASKGSRLQAAEFLLILDTIHAARVLRRSLLRIRDGDVRYPRLLQFVEGLPELASLETDLARSISPRGDVLDSASDDLARFRREGRVAQGRLTERLARMINGGKYAAVAQDTIVTLREGRYVIPIRAESRAQVPGIVHDVSASGQTLFVEPLEVVDLNNAWRENQFKEAREVERILDVLTGQVGGAETLLRTAIDALAAFDLAFAKARLSFQMRAVRPELAPPGSQRVDLRRARHPLLDPATVVPTDITLGERYRLLVITGPNTGGKTVALKTVGLLAAMAQTGLFVPAEDESVLPVFEAIFADIGDEQSIEQSLSTFSSHMINIVSILKAVSPRDLVLLDELGAGTDPQEGSALARALLDQFRETGALVVATTHYTEVKAYASSTDSVENASVEFDLKTLAPTFRLMIGIPGQSNALAIAKRLGMPGAVLENARALIDPDAARTEGYLSEIRNRRTEADRALARAHEAERDARQLRRAANAALREAEESRRNAREEALADAEQELASIRELSRQLDRTAGQAAAARAEVDERRLAVEAAQQATRDFKREHLSTVRLAESTEIKPGDRVTVVAFDEEGEVLAVDGPMADLQVGIVKVRQPLDNLRRLGGPAQTAGGRKVTKPAPPPPVSMEIDLRGYRVHELEAELEPYLIQAYQSGTPFVRIIHGKGTGALRQVVRDLLSRTPFVERFETAAQNEGGDGATVAHFQDR